MRHNDGVLIPHSVVLAVIKGTTLAMMVGNETIVVVRSVEGHYVFKARVSSRGCKCPDSKERSIFKVSATDYCITRLTMYSVLTLYMYSHKPRALLLVSSIVARLLLSESFTVVTVFSVALGRSMRVAEPDQIFAELSVFPRYVVIGEIMQQDPSHLHNFITESKVALPAGWMGNRPSMKRIGRRGISGSTLNPS